VTASATEMPSAQPATTSGYEPASSGCRTSWPTSMRCPSGSRM
jgi:hypothetical protein